MPPTQLTRQVAARIVEHIRAEQVAVGTRLVERTLADQLRVSRSPVRNALRLLAESGAVAEAEGGGYTVLDTADVDLAEDAEDSADEAVYLTIASDRLDGVLPDRITESALARRYSLTPAQLNRILRRASSEDWIERLPGYGWEFKPTLTSEQSYADSYRFRLTIEPAAILEPTFVLDRAALEHVREQQQRLADGAIHDLDNIELFTINHVFHETIAECSRNGFFIEALRRVDRLRRLVEYRRSLPRESGVVRCREHVEIADLLLADRRVEAAERMRKHLSTVTAQKTGS
ncbi:GntR family transcriptional regulator [Lentzea albida]|uniref:DNA-binding transcriptional regulator, GntR family n=1 Tax=Lentzea albida TaxID=65499 RepID=A0A1H9MV04_9PSEU|nr:GntR family transcriptional regulator [Lentzea albida]SER26943.1 DNA-binding transcriptional regulator, GntR family [Lentzea albida]